MSSKSFDDMHDEDFKCCNQGHCNPSHPLPTHSILSCTPGTGFSIPIPTATNPVLNPVPVASTTIDTSCLCNPSVKIDFNALINYQVLVSDDGTLTSPFTITFQLSKTCCDGAKIALGSWDYSFGSVALATTLTNSFNFSYCECTVCPGCCVYTVDIIRVSPGVIATATLTENASIRNSILSAIATSH